MKKPKLGKELDFKNLYDFKKLETLDNDFLFFLKSHSEELYIYLIEAREKHTEFSSSYTKDTDELVECAKLLEIFIADIFNIKVDLLKLNEKFVYNSKSFAFKKSFINKKVKSVDISELTNNDFLSVKKDLFTLLDIEIFDENIYIEKVSQ